MATMIGAADMGTEKIAEQTAVIEKAARLVGYANGKRYRARATLLFGDVPLKGATVLDIGCGPGAWAIWTALHGAKRVVGIEPEAAGSTKGTLDLFRRNIHLLGLADRVESYNATLQDLPVSGQFDVIVLAAVINHLDEEAVVNLHSDPVMLCRYIELLRFMRAKTTTGGAVIITDCGRSNFWARLGIRSPFDWQRQIEWHKHQDPSVWIRVFEKAGFRCAARRWQHIYPLGKLTTNAAVQYMTRSGFALTFRAV